MTNKVEVFNLMLFTSSNTACYYARIENKISLFMLCLWLIAPEMIQEVNGGLILGIDSLHGLLCCSHFPVLIVNLSILLSQYIYSTETDFLLIFMLSSVIKLTNSINQTHCKVPLRLRSITDWPIKQQSKDCVDCVWLILGPISFDDHAR